MSLSTQLGQFLAVALAYIVFAFAWGWYKARQDDADEENEPNRPDATEIGGET